MIVDTHAHLDDKAFAEDRENLLNSFAEAGIKAVINSGASLRGCSDTIAMMEKYPFVYGTLGVHPTETEELDKESFAWLKEMLQLPKVAALGEIGLDYYWDEPDRKVQKKWFRKQIQLAREIKLPIVVHSRDAAKDTLDVMKEEKAEEVGGTIHCFSYGKDMAREFLHMGFHFGIGGVVTFQNGKKLKEVVEYIPIEHILLETDSPYLAPVPHRGQRNSPLNLPLVAEQIAAIKGISYEKVLDITEENAKRLYRLPL